MTTHNEVEPGSWTVVQRPLARVTEVIVMNVDHPGDTGDQHGNMAASKKFHAVQVIRILVIIPNADNDK